MPCQEFNFKKATLDKNNKKFLTFFIKKEIVNFFFGRTWTTLNMCFSFSSPTNLAQKIKNSRLSFIFLHFLSNQTHKITQIYKIKRHAHQNLQNTKTFNKIFFCFETKHKNTKLKPKFLASMHNQTQNSTHIFLCFLRNQTQNSNLKSMNKTPY